MQQGGLENLTKPDYHLFGHPKGLYVCFLTEMWERFSFYGMKFLLVLYLTKYHLFSDEQGFSILGSYTAMVYAMPVIGGLLADRYLGMRKAVLFGGTLLVFGHFGMAWEGHAASVVNGQIMQDQQALQVFYFSLALIIMGVGFLKPNISTIVGRLYAENDPRRDSGFTIFYMGINIGAFLATIFCVWLGETYGWKYGFGLAGIGMIVGLMTFMRGQKHLHGLAEPTNPERLREPLIGKLSREMVIYFGAIAGLFVVWQMVQVHQVVHGALAVTSIAVLAGLLFFLFVHCDKVARERMLVLIVLTMSTVVFWALFEQSSGSMTLYADRVVDRQLFGFEVTAGQFGALNPLFIFLLAPIFAWLWTFLNKKGLEPSMPVKFALGIVQAGLGFVALVVGASMPDQAGKVAMIWLVLAYLLHTTGELCLSPVGLSAVTKLSVSSVVGVMMGAWFLASAYAGYVAAWIGKFTAIKQAPGAEVAVSEALTAYSDLYGTLFYVALAVGVLLLLISPILKRGMHGVR
ncbi:MAG: peptide MFS transporter [Gammaproteobacteria bacterium]|nr:peptide MFS transporter [Gammaproteobacteria bacterium]